MRYENLKPVVAGILLATFGATLVGCATPGELSRGQRLAMEIENEKARLGAKGFSPWRNYPVGEVTWGGVR